MNESSPAGWSTLVLLLPLLALTASSFLWLLLQCAIPQRMGWIVSVTFPLILAVLPAMLGVFVLNQRTIFFAAFFW